MGLTSPRHAEARATRRLLFFERVDVIVEAEGGGGGVDEMEVELVAAAGFDRLP
jgi:hypothetical protein